MQMVIYLLGSFKEDSQALEGILIHTRVEAYYLTRNPMNDNWAVKQN